jgi:hypothetical protein
MPQTIKLEDAPRRLRLKKMQIAGFKAKASKDGRVLVGFYKDKDGKTKPVTRSARELNRKKVVKNPKRFHTVSPLHTRKEFLFFADQFEEQYPFEDYDSIKDENFQHVLGEWLENANILKTIRGTVRKAIYYRFRESKKARRHGQSKGRTVWSIRRVFFSKGVHTISAPLQSFKIRNVKDIKRANLAFKEIVAEEKDDRSTDRVFMQDNRGYIIQHRRFPRKHYSPPLSKVVSSQGNVPARRAML